MKATSWVLLSVAAGVLAAAVGTYSVRADSAPDLQAQRKQMHTNFKQGNFKDAYEGFRQAGLDPDDDPRPGRRAT